MYDIKNLTVAEVQAVMDVEDPYYTCISMIFDGLNRFDANCGRYFMKYEDRSIPGEVHTEEDIVHIFLRDDGTLWIRY